MIPHHKLVARKDGRCIAAKLAPWINLAEVRDIAEQVKKDPVLHHVMIVSEHEDFCEIWDGGDMLPHIKLRLSQ